jgi:hypothetical protein
MRRVGAGGLLTALIVGLAMSGTVLGGPFGGNDLSPSGDSSSGAKKGNWWDGWTGGKAKEAKKAPVTVERPLAPNPAETMAFEQQRQMNAYLRRVAVCDRLRDIAFQNNDTELQRQADQLELRAWEIYRQHTANVAVKAEPIMKTEPVKKDAGAPQRGKGPTTADESLSSAPTYTAPPGDSGISGGGADGDVERASIMGREKP